MAYNALDIANKVIHNLTKNTDAGEVVSNLKLQKMLYYVQGFHLAYFAKPLFDEDIEAWMYGPVVPSVYDQYKANGNKGLESVGDVVQLSPEEESLFNEVLSVYGEFSAIGLMNMTHAEMPWKSTSVGMGNVIEKEKLRTFFFKKLK